MAEAKKQAEAAAKEKYVTVKIPKDRERNEDEIVWVNDRRFIIRRGEEVSVPECVAEVLRLKERALDEMYAYEEKVHNKK